MSSISGMPRCIDYYVLCFFVLSVSADTLNVNGSNYVAQDTRNNSSTIPSCEFNITSMVRYDYYDDEARLVVIIDLLPSFCKHQLEIELYSGYSCDSSIVLHTPTRLGSNSANQNGAEHPCSPDFAIPLMANELLELSEETAIFTLPHVYSANYCLFVYIDQEAAKRKTYYEPFIINNEHLTSLEFPTDWNTTINVFSPSRGKVLVNFTLPDPKYDFSQFIVTLQKINGNCENAGVRANPTDLGMMCLNPSSKKHETFIEVEFVNITDGNYCVLITPFDVRCHPNATYWKSDQFPNCTRFYPGTFTIENSNSSTTIPPCEFNVSNMLKYEYFGKEARLNISIDLLPSFCKRNQLEIQLYSGSCKSDKVLHTPTRLGSNSIYQNGEESTCLPNISIPIMANKLLELSEVQANFRLDHVYSGNYCLFVYIRQPEVGTHKTYIQSLPLNGSKTIVFPIVWNPTIQVFSPSRGKATVKFTQPDPKYGFSQFIVTLWKINGKCENGGVWAYPTVLETMCLKPYSNYEQSQTPIEEKFENLSEGNYCVSITPFDVRCHPEATYWRSDQFSCTRFYPRTITTDGGSLIEPVGPEPVCCSRVDWSMIGIGTFFAISAFATALTLLWRFRKRLKSIICNTVTPRTVPIPIFDVVPKPQPSIVSVLLLYATDDPVLCKKVQKLKHVLTTIGFCNVFDFRDESAYDKLATYGPDWISKLIASPDMKIIVVVSTGAREAQKLTQGIGTNSSKPEELTDPLDYVYLQGLKEVMISGRETNVFYRRCFSVRFPEITGPEVTLSSITPFVFFLLPENTDQLLWHIHGCLPENSFWNVDCNLW